MESKTLKQVQADFLRVDAKLKAAGFAGSGENPRIAVYAPNTEYPMPWGYSRSPEGICTMYAANNARVASWLRESDAKAILEEVSVNIEVD